MKMQSLIEVVRLRLCMKIARMRIRNIEKRQSALNARLTETFYNLSRYELALRDILFRELQTLRPGENRNVRPEPPCQESEECLKSRFRENPVWTPEDSRAVDGL